MTERSLSCLAFRALHFGQFGYEPTRSAQLPASVVSSLPGPTSAKMAAAVAGIEQLAQPTLNIHVPLSGPVLLLVQRVGRIEAQMRRGLRRRFASEDFHTRTATTRGGQILSPRLLFFTD
jgi:hypothetical protein